MYLFEQGMESSDYEFMEEVQWMKSLMLEHKFSHMSKCVSFLIYLAI